MEEGQGSATVYIGSRTQAEAVQPRDLASPCDKKCPVPQIVYRLVRQREDLLFEHFLLPIERNVVHIAKARKVKYVVDCCVISFESFSLDSSGQNQTAKAEGGIRN